MPADLEELGKVLSTYSKKKVSSKTKFDQALHDLAYKIDKSKITQRDQAIKQLVSAIKELKQIEAITPDRQTLLNQLKNQDNELKTEINKKLKALKVEKVVWAEAKNPLHYIPENLNVQGVMKLTSLLQRTIMTLADNKAISKLTKSTLNGELRKNLKNIKPQNPVVVLCVFLAAQQEQINQLTQPGRNGQKKPSSASKHVGFFSEGFTGKAESLKSTHKELVKMAATLVKDGKLPVNVIQNAEKVLASRKDLGKGAATQLALIKKEAVTIVPIHKR